jgi:hypothetical protein
MMIKCSYDIHWLKSEFKLSYDRAYSIINMRHKSSCFICFDTLFTTPFD